MKENNGFFKMNQVNLSDIITLQKGKKPKEIKSACCDSFFPYVDIKAFETGKIDKFTDGEKCVKCEDNDLLIVCDGSRSGLIGKAVKGFVGSTLARIDCDLSVDKDYLYYFIQSKYKLLNSNVKGTGTPHLKQELLKLFRLYLPSIEQQKLIVKQIEDSLSQLDSAVATLNKTKQQLEIYRQAVLRKYFDCGYETRKLNELCYFITKGTTPAKKELFSGQGEIPFVKVYNLTFTNKLDFSINPTFVSNATHKGFLKRSITYPGDVLMNIVGPPMGKVSIVPHDYPEWNINQAIARFRCGEKLNNKYLAYYLGFSDTINKLKSKSKATAGQFNLTLKICREIEIPLPNIEEQQRIADEIDNRLCICEIIIDTINQSLQQAEALRQSILKQAFEGNDGKE